MVWFELTNVTFANRRLITRLSTWLLHTLGFSKLAPWCVTYIIFILPLVCNLYNIHFALGV